MAFDENIVEIIEPTKKLFDLFNEIKQNILEVLPSSHVELIGSLAVPMKGRKEMDILIETKDVEEAQNLLKEKGFSKGPIIDQEGFCRNRNYEIIIELHIIPLGNKKVKIYQKLIKKIQNDRTLKERFEKFKMSFEGSSISEYKKAKNKFLKENNLINN